MTAAVTTPDNELRERLLDLCARQARVVVRFEVHRGCEVGCVVGVLGAVDHHLRIIVGRWSERYNVPIVNLVSIEEIGR